MTKLLFKRILVDIQDEHDETLCRVCEKYGQRQTECNCIQNDECAYHIMKLAEDYYKNNVGADNDRT